jgi:hypothetical protein
MWNQRQRLSLQSAPHPDGEENIQSPRELEAYKNPLWEECRRRDELVDSNSKSMPVEFCPDEITNTKQNDLSKLCQSMADFVASLEASKGSPSGPEGDDLDRLRKSMAEFVASQDSSKASATSSSQSNQPEPSSRSFKAKSPHTPKSSQETTPRPESRRESVNAASRSPLPVSQQRGPDDLIPSESQPSSAWTISIPVPSPIARTCGCQNAQAPNNSVMVEPYPAQTKEPWLEETVDLPLTRD